MCDKTQNDALHCYRFFVLRYIVIILIILILRFFISEHLDCKNNRSIKVWWDISLVSLSPVLCPTELCQANSSLLTSFYHIWNIQNYRLIYTYILTFLVPYDDIIIKCNSTLKNRFTPKRCDNKQLENTSSPPILFIYLNAKYSLCCI